MEKFEVELRKKTTKNDWAAFKLLVAGELDADSAMKSAIQMGSTNLVKMAIVLGADVEKARAIVTKNKAITELLKNAPYSPEKSMLNEESTNNRRTSIQTSRLRVLSLDGGGIRGIMQVLLLEAIQKATKLPINQCFDWIGGTSTGGLLSLSIMKGKSLRQCLNMYIHLMEDVFDGNAPYKPDKLKDFLMKYYEDRNLKEEPPCPRVMITALQVRRKTECAGHLKLFRNYEGPTSESAKLKDDPNNPDKTWLAARATSSVPLLIAPAAPDDAVDGQIPSTSTPNHYLDGGLVANNPTLNLLTDIHHLNQECQDKKMKVGVVVSLGTGRWSLSNAPVELKSTTGSWWNPLNILGNLTAMWRMKTVILEQVGISNDVSNTHAKAMAECLNAKHHRLCPKLDIPVDLDCKDSDKLFAMIWTTHEFIYRDKKDEIEEIASQLLEPKSE